jgi:hypothetical protein
MALAGILGMKASVGMRPKWQLWRAPRHVPDSFIPVLQSTLGRMDLHFRISFVAFPTRHREQILI